jgi:glycosyltransferase involved in cell wall biosynthesis
VKRLSLEKLIHYAGFVSGDGKNKLLASSDIFCFPTYFAGESAPVVLTEAFAFGLPVVTTNWRNIPDFFPQDYPGIVDIKRPDLVAAAILKVLELDPVLQLRQTFLARFTAEQHIRRLSEAFLAVGEKEINVPALGHPNPGA